LYSIGCKAAAEERYVGNNHHHGSGVSEGVEGSKSRYHAVDCVLGHRTSYVTKGAVFCGHQGSAGDVLLTRRRVVIVGYCEK
jgi:hypothetical protein